MPPPPAPAPTASFPQPSREAWLALVDKTLDGGDFTRRLVSTTADGIEVQPLCTAETAAAPLHPLRAAAGDAARPWDLRTRIDHPDPARANALALQDLSSGAQSILLGLDPSGRTGVAVADQDGLARTLDGVLLDLAPVALDAGFMGPAAAGWLGELAKGAPRAPLALNLDPLTAFAEAGASPGPMTAHMELAARTAAGLAATYPEAGLFLASGRAVHEAGGTEAQELGFAAACALAYVRALDAEGAAPDRSLAAVVLGLQVDGEYFTAIAKLRAARAIWARLAHALGSDAPARIEARSSRRRLSTLDPFTNLLRLTEAGFAAAVGGADAIQLDPFTQPLQSVTGAQASPRARRQARNIQLVLMEESGLGRVADPAGGAWYLETLSDALARAGWAYMQAIEAEGGALAALTGDRIARDVAEARARRETEVARRKAGLVGVSEFANLLEDGVEVEAVDATAFAVPAPDLAMAGSDDACPALIAWRAAEPFERLRAEAARRTPRPQVFLATLGPLADHAARAGFARNLFAAGGLAAATGEVADYAAEATPLAVLCGADAAYEAQGAEAVRLLKASGAGAVWLAGRPTPALEASGVDGFVYAGCDVAAALERALSLTGDAARATETRA